MRQALRAVCAVVLSVLVLPAQAEPFSSQEFGFSINYHAQHEQESPKPQTNSRGQTESTVTMLKSAVERTMCMVGVQRYVVPATADVAVELTANRDSFIRPLSATHSTTEGKFQGYPALQFTWSKTDGRASGRGMVVIVPKARRRVYIVATAILSDAPAAATAEADRCFTSFRLR
jgi:hypothetical protein